MRMKILSFLACLFLFCGIQAQNKTKMIEDSEKGRD